MVSEKCFVVREKSGNFFYPDGWQPCRILLSFNSKKHNKYVFGWAYFQRQIVPIINKIRTDLIDASPQSINQ